MPQGTPTCTWNSRGAGGLRQGGLAAGAAAARRLRPVAALSVLALLAACGGQTTQQPASGRAAVTYGGYNRPASYDPPGPPSDPWGPWIREASRRFDVPERWIREVMRQESGGRPNATSRVGAMGLMQVMPGTYRELAARYGLGDDPYHPYDSIMAGTAYIREMYDLYGSPAFLAAYNAGPRRLEDYLWNNRSLPSETRNYVARIGPNIIDHHPRRRVAQEIALAAEIPLNIPPGPRRMDSATMLALREQRDALQPGIQVAQLPPGPVVRMEPIPDGSTLPQPTPFGAPVQVASLDAGAAAAVVRMEPIPDGSTPEGAARLAEAEGRAAAEPAPPPPAPSRLASAIAPRAMAAPVPRQGAAPRQAQPRQAAPRPQSMLAANVPPSAPRQAPAARSGFGLIPTAQASPLPASVRQAVANIGNSGNWAVQVGAFSSENLARSAANSARGSAGSQGRAVVLPLTQGRSKLYRARVTGLSQAAARAVCDRLRSRGGCMVLSPDTQG